MKNLMLLFFTAIPFFANAMQEFEALAGKADPKSKNTGFEKSFINSLREEKRKKQELWEAHLKQTQKNNELPKNNELQSNQINRGVEITKSKL